MDSDALSLTLSDSDGLPLVDAEPQWLTEGDTVDVVDCESLTETVEDEQYVIEPLEVDDTDCDALALELLQTLMVTEAQFVVDGDNDTDCELVKLNVAVTDTLALPLPLLLREASPVTTVAVGDCVSD